MLQAVRCGDTDRAVKVPTVARMGTGLAAAREFAVNNWTLPVDKALLATAAMDGTG